MRYARREPRRSTTKPLVPSHCASESLPRCRCTTSEACAPGARRGSQRSNSWCNGSLPIRIGGFDHMPAKGSSAGTWSGSHTTTLSIPFARAFAMHNERARSLTSIAYTVARGARRASARAIGPYPQPRSRRAPSPERSGVGPSRSRYFVPGSTADPANTPRSVANVSVTSGSVRVTDPSRCPDVGCGSK